tara:strand:- start:35 stop:445 length:411 start_codon:yes stop_codon:yes gene_type:complete
MSDTDDAHRGYLKWRKTIPWTDAEILAALRDEVQRSPNDWIRDARTVRADRFERSHRLSRFLLSQVIHVLVVRCEVCGKTAHYRVGVRGFCRAHRTSPQRVNPARERRREQIATTHEDRRARLDTKLRARDRLRRM